MEFGTWDALIGETNFLGRDQEQEIRLITRLISVVSKPMFIVVVVVVIEVVFVKKILGPKKFWLKNICVQKTLGQKELGPKKLWSKQMLSKKLRFKKILGPKQFLVQEILGTKILGKTVCL